MVPPYLHIIQFHTRPDLRYVYSLLFRTTSPSSSQLLARVLDVVVLSVQEWLRGAVPFPCAHVLDRRLNGRRTNVGLGRCECWLPRAPLLQHVSVFLPALAALDGAFCPLCMLFPPIVPAGGLVARTVAPSLFRCWYPLLAHCFVLAAAACIACPLDSACFLSCVFAGSDVLAVSLLRVDGVPFFWDGMVPWDGFFGGDAVGLGMHFRVSVSRYVWVTYRILI